jgi:hypothetical protein
VKFYRYQDIFYESGPKIDLLEYKLIRKTPKGWWIIRDWGTFSWNDGLESWVSATARKRLAYPTKKEALHSYKMRKMRQIGIYKARLEDAEILLEKIKDMEFVGPVKRRNYGKRKV